MVTDWNSEISKAQDRLTDLLQDVYASYPQYREIVRMILSTVGRGGEGDVGQRIRDEILVIQVHNIFICFSLVSTYFPPVCICIDLNLRANFLFDLKRNNDCKGGMMEEWHQKLHNNTSPDDVVICQVMWLLFSL